MSIADCCLPVTLTTGHCLLTIVYCLLSTA
jgi:hypothetical protein